MTQGLLAPAAHPVPRAGCLAGWTLGVAEAAAMEERLGSAVDRSDRGKEETARAGRARHQVLSAPGLGGSPRAAASKTQGHPNSDSSRKGPQAEGSPRSAAHQGLEKRESPIQSPPLLPPVPSAPHSLPSHLPPSLPSSLQLPPFSLELTKNYVRHTRWDYDPILQLGKGEAQRGAGTCSGCFPVPFLPRPTKQRPAPGLPKWILDRTLILTNHVVLLGNKSSLFDSKSCHGQLPSGQQSCSKGPGRGERVLGPGCSGRSCSCLHFLPVTSIQLP